MLQFDLENERVAIVNYRQRIRQAEAIKEFALGEVLRESSHKNRNVYRTWLTRSESTPPKIED